MEKHSEISEIYEVALKKSPRNEELCTHLFMSYVRTSQFKKQQQVAMSLYKMFQKNPYYFWVVMSYVLQASVCDDENIKINMLLPLAEKMMLKFVDQSKIESDAEVHLYLMVLEMQNKQKTALEAINGPLATFLSSYANEKKKIEYLQKLERWSDVNLSYKNLIETRPGEWSIYQGYLESVTRLIEANYAPIADDNNSCAVPDYTVPMARNFIEKMKRKEIENNERRNRAPFLACLELQKKTYKKMIHTSSEGCPDDLIKLLVEYFQLFGEKSVCFSDLFIYLDLLDSTEKSEFLEIVKSLSMASSEGNVMKNIKEMSRAITIEKFSRYLGEHEQLSSEEMIAHARHLMSMHKEGLKYGNDLLPTDFQHSDDFALLAAHLLLDCCDRSGHSRSWHRVIITLESAIKSSPSNIQLKLLVSRLYCVLGAVGPCVMYMDSMEFKHILYDTLGLNVSRYAAPLGHFKSAKDFYSLALKFYQANKKDVSFCCKHDAVVCAIFKEVTRV
ncbi:Hypothetical predicted protein [Paramuricea clavata]|nr:Hypothetical predicted protein [Paramuricea clavata]